MATTLSQSENLKMANMLWKLIEPQDAEVKDYLRQRLDYSEIASSPKISAKLESREEIIKSLRGCIQLTPEDIEKDERLQYILSK